MNNSVYKGTFFTVNCAACGSIGAITEHAGLESDDVQFLYNSYFPLRSDK